MTGFDGDPDWQVCFEMQSDQAKSSLVHAEQEIAQEFLQLLDTAIIRRPALLNLPRNDNGSP